MSAYICDNKTISALAKAFDEYSTRFFKFEADNFTDEGDIGGFGVIFDSDATIRSIGQALLDQNYKSVNYRYNEETETPRFKYEDVEINEGIVYGCMNYYEYQACETPGYENSKLHKSFERMKKVLLERLLRKNGMAAPYGFDGHNILE